MTFPRQTLGGARNRRKPRKHVASHTTDDYDSKDNNILLKDSNYYRAYTAVVVDCDHEGGSMRVASNRATTGGVCNA